ncbi:TPA_asm: type 1 fimbrial protein [Salmonella enterica subsp. salamae serovar 58:d:z6]|uniref:Type 1 fimbrial protein n=1 Tax=Salmonella enterica subsp. salamae serovar 58:d:z6 TaxID=41517 RepID=A0A728LIW0_SALER|nr:fimbrial protein [Salmonella enterica]ECG1422077.1 type 1 fimbrial protein [Salmonella enterica subsp. salamae str. CFSAN000559]QRR37597.1 type 1 fimbrial protein [Salmonella enterica subsp. enterica]HAE2716527.1 type 1 fimbrial protein [Salmonella enterica subsp. salamae serovar 58:d:z6]HAE2990564.1 type 1 fimbrial protein [Salmonella enterica subsp. salamae serovar 58:d:z6]HAE4546599.1 type 1 fimbrial protein [Salmonella enterica subsp. salamae serovar 58:d:z6]
MKKKVILSTSLLFAAAIGVAHAATDDQGTVTFNGLIINPPCEITDGSKDTQVTFTPLGTNAFAGLGSEASQTQPVSITLSNCPKDTNVNLTFAGDTAADNTQLKATTGSEDTGVAIVMYGTDGTTKVTFNDEPVAALQQMTGNDEQNEMTFNYNSKVVATVDPANIKGGDFIATTTYTIYYP